MKTEKELNAKILALTLKINKNHPELSKFLEEMPVTVPNESSPEITNKILKDYIESLKNLMKKST